MKLKTYKYIRIVYICFLKKKLLIIVETKISDFGSTASISFTPHSSSILCPK